MTIVGWLLVFVDILFLVVMFGSYQYISALEAVIEELDKSLTVQAVRLNALSNTLDCHDTYINYLMGDLSENK